MYKGYLVSVIVCLSFVTRYQEFSSLIGLIKHRNLITIKWDWKELIINVGTNIDRANRILLNIYFKEEYGEPRT